jgi:hypothetical protein
MMTGLDEYQDHVGSLADRLGAIQRECLAIANSCGPEGSYAAFFAAILGQDFALARDEALLIAGLRVALSSHGIRLVDVASEALQRVIAGTPGSGKTGPHVGPVSTRRQVAEEGLDKATAGGTPEPPAGIWTEDPAVEGPFVALVRDTPVDVATRNPNFREGSRHHARAKQFLTPKLFADVYGQQQQWILAVGGKLAAGWRLPDGAVLEPSGHVVASPKKAGSSGS